MQAAAIARLLARLNAGSSIAAKIAMMAITTSNSIKVKALEGEVGCGVGTDLFMLNAILSWTLKRPFVLQCAFPLQNRTILLCKLTGSPVKEFCRHRPNVYAGPTTNVYERNHSRAGSYLNR
jgi:hypothetical protein